MVQGAILGGAVFRLLFLCLDIGFLSSLPWRYQGWSATEMTPVPVLIPGMVSRGAPDTFEQPRTPRCAGSGRGLES